MTATDLDGRAAVVTGAGRGIGRSIALGLAEEGMQVVLAARSDGELSAVAAEIRDRGSEAVAVPTDVTDTGDVSELFERARERFGQVDLLVNNAGTTARGDLWELTDEEWERVVDVNLNGTFRCAREALAGGMVARGEGTIVNVSSITGRSASRGRAPTGPRNTASRGSRTPSPRSSGRPTSG